MKRIGVTLLVDGNNLAMRAVHAAKHSHMRAAGVNTGPLTIFMTSLAKIVYEVNPTRFAVAWDGGSYMRTQLIAGYKANRRPAPTLEDLTHDTFRLIMELLSLLDIPQTRVPGYEADDVIAAWWHLITPDDATRITIASSDKDFLQLIGDSPHQVPTDQLRLSSADTPTDWWYEERLWNELGYEPHHWPLIAALAGDKADNVLGIPGIGPKRAQKLLESYGWNLVEAVRAEYPDYLLQVQDNLLAVNLREPDETLTVTLPKRFDRTSDASPQLVRFLDTYQMISLKGKIMTKSLWGPMKIPGRPLQLPLPLPDPVLDPLHPTG